MNKSSSIYVAGHNGMVGSAIIRFLLESGFYNVITKSSKDLDLRNQSEVEKFFMKNKPEYVFICAAKVGGIHANNTMRAQFLYENLQIQNNLIHFAYKSKVKKLLFLGSSCIYPRDCKQPIKEEYLLSGPLENSNEPYAIAKISGIKMCENYYYQYGSKFFSIMPTNLYGPNDNYDYFKSHFFPALIRKALECKIKNKKTFEIWGSGKPLREMIFVDDVADACVYFINKKTKYTLINIGTGKDMTIKQYANFMIKKLNLKVKLKFNKSKPDGMYRKLLDVSRAKKLGWVAKTTLSEGFDITYKDLLKKYK